MTQCQGILPAIVTPLDEHGRFAEAPYARLLERLFKQPIDGLYVAGQTGEGLHLLVEDRKRLLEATVRLTPKGKHLMVHVGAFRTADAVELARHAAASGATALSSLPPVGLWSFAEVKEYYRAITTATTLPFFVYFFPEISAAVRTLEQIEELLALPNVVGLKFTEFDLYRLSLLRARNAIIFNGRDEVLAAGLLMGANGGIGSFYNLAPEYFVEIYQHAAAGRWQEAVRAQHEVNELLTIVLRYPMMPAIKQILTWTGIEAGACVEPRRARLTAEEAGRLRTELRQSRFVHLAG